MFDDVNKTPGLHYYIRYISRPKMLYVLYTYIMYISSLGLEYIYFLLKGLE